MSLIHVRTHDNLIHPAIVAGGAYRLLASLPIPTGHGGKLFAADGGFQVMPISDILAYVAAYGAGGQLDSYYLGIPVKDQGQRGSCNPTAWASAGEEVRALCGWPVQALSGSYLYSLINGGYDQGSSIADGGDALVKHGTVSQSLTTADTIFPYLMPAGIEQQPHFKLDDYLVCDPGLDPFLADATAYILGMPAVSGIQVGGDFNDLDRNGVAPVASGPGNHAVRTIGLKVMGGNLYIIKRNSWGAAWGMKGDFLITPAHYTGYGDQPSVAFPISPAFDPGMVAA